jgi:hypothetical protein
MIRARLADKTVVTETHGADCNVAKCEGQDKAAPKSLSKQSRNSKPGRRPEAAGPLIIDHRPVAEHMKLGRAYYNLPWRGLRLSSAMFSSSLMRTALLFSLAVYGTPLFVSASPSATTTAPARPTCTVIHTPGADDSPSIRTAVSNCTNNATILFQKGVEYNR